MEVATSFQTSRSYSIEHQHFLSSVKEYLLEKETAPLANHSNGASLEWLARGAVSFSRSYCYDGQVGDSQAKYKGNKIKKVASTYIVILKRKTQNIRRHYYTMCNRIHIEASFMNIDEKDETYTNKQSNADVNSILWRSPHDTQGDDMSSVSKSQKLVADTQLATENDLFVELVQCQL
ncbi:hypothetical protein L195_g039633 [Trifolium pratense]|uniref:Uncharacterized protein n=1 Tax=Trifolium pratense TaxID=57577 RepID=A0A2K3LYH5_TRIPR|nr:hypothetical protein L195_g039633 [Trifolium pratense]